MYETESEINDGGPMLPDLGTYVGERNQEGERHGQGDATLPNGDRYVGEYKYGKRDGEGSYYYAVGRYQGDFHQGKKQGYGVMIYPDGSKYEGNWEQGEKSGQGKYTYPNGDIYEGDWKEDRRDGQGMYTVKATGDCFEGTWIDGERTGKGTNRNSSYTFDGNFKNGKPCGMGTLTFAKAGCQQHGFYAMTDIVKQVDKRMELVAREPMWTCTRLTGTTNKL